jgi:gluconolactonase
MTDLYEIHDARFRQLIHGNAALERLYAECRWAEGPVYLPHSDELWFSDIPNNRVMRWVPRLGVAVLHEPSGNANGHTRDAQGRVIRCEHLGRRVVRLEHDGGLTVLAEHYRGGRLNSPNDVVCKSDGSVWFTDPDYGILTDYEGRQAPPEQPGCCVYRLDADGRHLQAVVVDMVKPNGLAFSPDERWLYVADSAASHVEGGPHHIRRFEVQADGSVAAAGVLAQVSPGLPDGLRVDVLGNVWSSAADGVHCYASDGTLLGKLRVPEVVSNLSFGGPRRNRLFVTATTSLYAVYVAVAGAEAPLVAAAQAAGAHPRQGA